MRRSLVAALPALALLGCGYQVAGKADTIPDDIETIAVPAFENATTEYKLEQYLTGAVVREFLSHTRYRVVHDENSADATLRGVVVNFLALPASFDIVTGRATSVNTITQIQLVLRERETGRTLYENPLLEHRERYEVSADPDVYFEERQAALTRSSESLARTIVSAVLEGF